MAVWLMVEWERREIAVEPCALPRDRRTTAATSGVVARMRFAATIGWRCVGRASGWTTNGVICAIDNAHAILYMGSYGQGCWCSSAFTERSGDGGDGCRAAGIHVRFIGLSGAPAKIPFSEKQTQYYSLSEMMEDRGLQLVSMRLAVKNALGLFCQNWVCFGVVEGVEERFGADFGVCLRRIWAFGWRLAPLRKAG